MKRTCNHARRSLAFLLFALATMAPIAAIGCAARVSTVYDGTSHDWHRWDENERQAYHRYWEEKHQPYRPYGGLRQEEANDYWNWRHGHSDSQPH